MMWGTWSRAHGFGRVTSSVLQLNQYLCSGCCYWQPFRSKTASSLWSLPLSCGLCSAKLTQSAQKSEGNKFVRLRQMNRQVGHLFNNQAKSSVNPSMVDSHHCWPPQHRTSFLRQISYYGDLGKKQDPDACDKTKEMDEYSLFLTSPLFGK